MRYRTPRLATAGLAAVTTLLTTTTPIAAAATPAAATTAPTATASVPQPDALRPLLLIDGSRVLAGRTADGTLSAASVQPAARGGQFLSLVTGGQAYEIPGAAVPYLGHGLDPGLFRLAALASYETGGRLPVRLSYRGSRPPAIPGITVTHAATGTAGGYLTASSSAVFGAALGRQYAADHSRASYGMDGLFAGQLSISLAGPASAPVRQARPAFPMHTLTVTATTVSGQPDNGDPVIVINADNAKIFGANPSQAVSFFHHGVAKYSVPAGHYWAVGEFSPFGLMSISRVVTLPQFGVTANTTVHMPERSATSRVTMVTPKPATAYGTNFWILRTGHRGPATLVGWANNAHPLWVTPASRVPTVGTLRAYASQQLASPAGPGTPYRYVVNYRDPAGVISRQRYRVQASDLATVHENYYDAGRGVSQTAFFGSLPGSFAGYVEPDIFNLRMPARLTTYLGGNIPDMTWSSYADVVNRGGDLESGEEDLFHPFPAGEQVTETWNAYPLHPAVNDNPDPHMFLTGLQPSATRAGSTLRLTIIPFGDNYPGHLGTGLIAPPGTTAGGSYQIDQNGQQIASGKVKPPTGGATWFTTHAKLSPQASVVRFTLDVVRSGPAYPLSTATHTVWTWHSAPARGATLPANWYCYISSAGQEVQRCAVQPMMTLGYAVAGLSLAGRAPAGHEVVDLTVGHLQLVKPIAVTRAAVQVSFNGGKTWRTARVTGGHGRYQAEFDAPAGAYVMLRTSARDAADGSVTETITRAFQIAP